MSETHKISFRERIRLNLIASMEKANINQVQLAEKLGISKGTVNNWARGINSPDLDLIPRICDVLGISVLDLYAPTGFEEQEALSTKNSPSTDDSVPGENVSAIFDKLNQMLVSEGLIRDGDDLTDKQTEVLLAVCKIIEATFND